MNLFTLQAPGLDITSRAEPTSEYTDPQKGAYYELSFYLGWVKWVWCFKNFSAFEENEWMRFKGQYCLWQLDIPEAYITWGSLEGQCGGGDPADFIFKDWRDIETRGEIAMGLVEAPIRPEWVLWQTIFLWK